MSLPFVAPDLGRLLLAEARRCSKIWAAAVAFQLLVLWVPLSGHASVPDIAKINGIFIPAVVAANALAPTRQRGALAARLLLPLSRQAQGSAQWCLAIAFPGLLLSASALAVWLLERRLGAAVATLWPWLLGIWGTLGLFVALELLSRRRATVSGVLSSIVVGVVVLAFIATPKSVFAIFVAAVSSIGLPAILYLYWRREDLPRWYMMSARRGDIRMVLQLWPTVADRRARLGQVALRLLAWLAAGAGGGTALMLAVKPAAMRDVTLIVSAGLLPTLSARLVGWRSMVRVLRALPLTAERIALSMLAMALAPNLCLVLGVLAAFAALAAPAAPFPATALVVPSLLLLLSAQLLLVPTTLRFGRAAGVVGALLLAVLAMPLSMIEIFMSVGFAGLRGLDAGSLLGGALAAACVLGLASFLWTRHEVRSGRRAYRPLVADSIFGIALNPNDVSAR